ncbi:uncharacterized protein LOC116386770 isoform X1 [Anarrhichthys ocellatus]|uniref:uncharacterized protein LOC116386770 isoform X1 n=1 Tax=Anarrhichthys ocellatus TaxID=433405 RepID=UPI0012ECFEAA|nr:uncharacterized protein LOC116386770 isoform X1 [Anarrhichthys ocellatus]
MWTIVSLESFIHLLSTMSSRTSSVLLLITLWASMEDGLSLPVIKRLEVEVGDGVPTQRVRIKRCACSSLLDSECHYFCHLDIIWINTPSKTTVYGLGSALSRRRRSIRRCTCADLDDHNCTNFCHHSPEVTSQKRTVKRSQLNILSSLRKGGKQKVAEGWCPTRESPKRHKNVCLYPGVKGGTCDRVLQTYHVNRCGGSSLRGATTTIRERCTCGHFGHYGRLVCETQGGCLCVTAQTDRQARH